MAKPIEDIYNIRHVENPVSPLVVLPEKRAIRLRVQEVIRHHPWSMPILKELAVFDRGTFRHSRMVAQAAAAFLELPEQEEIGSQLQEAFILAAFLHDTGKMSVEGGKAIIEDPSFFPWDSPEMAKMRGHVEAGYDRINMENSTNDRVGKLAALLMATHHRYQEHGYGVEKKKIEEQMQQLGLSAEEREQISFLQRSLAALDQAVGLAQGGEGGHSSMGVNEEAVVKNRLNHEKEGAEKNPEHGFAKITDSVMLALRAVGVFDRALPKAQAS